MDFYILIFLRDTQYIVYGALFYVFLCLSSVLCIHCYRKKKFGFRLNYSTNNALIAIVESMKKQLDARNYTTGVFADLKDL